MSSYTTVSTAANDGSAVHNHPDVGAGLGIGIAQTLGLADMPAVKTLLADKSFLELGKESDVLVYTTGGDTTETHLVSWYRSFPLQRTFAHYCIREQGGKLRWISKNSARAETTESALQSCGLSITGLADTGASSDCVTNNALLKAANIPLVLYKTY